MRNLGIAFLALIALFIGGCSILYTFVALNAYWGYGGGGILIFTMPPLIFSVVIGWWAWLIYKRRPGSQLTNPDQPPEDNP